MRPSVRRLARAGVAGLLVILLVAPSVRAESALWTLTASPLAATTGTATTYTLVATNLDPLAAALSSNEIGCVVLDVPANFTVAPGSATVIGSNAGGSWTASLTGNRVRVWAGSGGDRLTTSEWVRFRLVATAGSVGSLAWGARAYRRTDCGGSGALLAVPPVVVVSGPTVTPLPTVIPTVIPTIVPTATPQPTAIATATPLPTPMATPASSSSPTPRSTSAPPTNAPSAPTDGAVSPVAQPSDGGTEASAPAEPDGGPTATPAAAAAASPAGPGTGGTSGGAEPRRGSWQLRGDEDHAAFGFGSEVSLVGFSGWTIPAGTIGVSGLFVILWVTLQAVGGIAWLPAVRALRRGRAGGRRLRRRSPGSA